METREIHCLVCKRKTPASVKMESTEKVSDKGKKTTRYQYVGECGSCHKKVRQYAKKPSEPTVEAPVAKPAL